MKLAQLSKWLRKTPQPATIVVDDAKRIDVGTKGGRWTEVARSIEALGASKLTALDGQGNVIRAIVLEESDSDDSPKSELQGDLQALSRIIADAYEKGTQAPGKLLDAAMTFIERQGQRLVAQDREIERLRGVNARLTAEILQLKAIPVSDDSDGVGGVLGALMQGVVQAQMQEAEAPAPAPAAPNGKAVRK